MLKRILILLALLTLTNTGLSLGQQPTGPRLTPAEVKELIRSAQLRINEYRNKFKDLTADEEQEIEEYDVDGKLRRQRRIVSDLIIYQSQLDASSMSEYRNIRMVDGVTVAKRDERLVSLFARLAKADSVKKELERINREGRRYDLDYSFYGLTLNEGLLLNENFLPYFQFTDAGREQIKGREVIVLQYQQVAQSPDLTMKLPGELKGAGPRYRGRLWLDAETKQLWREERELTLEHASLSQPLVLLRFEFEYTSSSFGILTPQRVVFITYNKGRDRAGIFPGLRLGGKTTFQYSGFRRFDVSSPDAAVTPPVKPRRQSHAVG
ncbi:MAG TPA: hypothetical protein VJS44_10165 [Pyrinomonadaceae bacterium]|nr:hypothetical protein [Pyrinomonadaceae bacterium]